MEHHQITINKQVSIVSIGQPQASTKHLWICLHGYGQLAAWFAKNFEHLNHENRVFVVPEGPHRFYLNGTEGRVGASWMTKENRLSDIKDQFGYLEKLIKTYHRQCPQAHIHVLGFSQGVATAIRWIEHTKLPIKSLVCWAGSFPPDVIYNAPNSPFKALEFLACFGDGDQYISIDNANVLLKRLMDLDINVHVNFYHGKHKIYRDLLNEVVATCEN